MASMCRGKIETLELLVVPNCLFVGFPLADQAQEWRRQRPKQSWEFWVVCYRRTKTWTFKKESGRSSVLWCCKRAFCSPSSSTKIHLPQSLTAVYSVLQTEEIKVVTE